MLKIENVEIYFPVKKGLFGKTKYFIKAVDDVSLEINQGESFGLVGESGSGKTTLARSILNLVKMTSGELYFKSEKVDFLNREEITRLREKVQIVFQDPFSSLNPRKTIGSILIEPLLVHKRADKKSAMEKAFGTLISAGLKQDDFYKYPHEFSGGQRQRIGIARVLILDPEFIILDEPVSSLDVSVQAQILNLLKDLQKKHNLTYLFIAHNLNVIRFFCDRVAVMYSGKIMETADAEEIFTQAQHPYTKLLLASIPEINKKKNIRTLQLKEEAENFSEVPCKFINRCIEKTDLCGEEVSELKLIKGNHYVRCRKYEKE